MSLAMTSALVVPYQDAAADLVVVDDVSHYLKVAAVASCDEVVMTQERWTRRSLVLNDPTHHESLHPSILFEFVNIAVFHPMRRCLAMDASKIERLCQSFRWMVTQRWNSALGALVVGLGNLRVGSIYGFPFPHRMSLLLAAAADR